MRRYSAFAAFFGVLLLVSAVPAAASVKPVYVDDFPDPFVLATNSGYYAFSTQVWRGGWVDVPRLQSVDLASWSGPDNALEQLPAWAERGNTWAPSVLRRESGYVLYYTVRHKTWKIQCISRATASSPGGPYIDTSTGPLVCQRRLGGSIDPSPFVDANGNAYLLWKSDDNALGQPTKLWSRLLSPDGLGFAPLSKAKELLRASQSWEGGIIEGPTMVRADNGIYHLFYGANRWDTKDAAIGWATCSSPISTCTKPLNEPWLATKADENRFGPAGPEIFRAVDVHDGKLRLASHAWNKDPTGYHNGGVRSFWIDTVTLPTQQGAPPTIS